MGESKRIEDCRQEAATTKDTKLHEGVAPGIFVYLRLLGGHPLRDTRKGSVSCGCPPAVARSPLSRLR